MFGQFLKSDKLKFTDIDTKLLKEKEKGISGSIISQGQGHSAESVTNLYLKSFDHGVLDEANSQVSLL